MKTKEFPDDSESIEDLVESGVALAGFGKFNIKVVILCGLIYLNTGIGIGSVGFVLPSAACDFNLTTIDKGRMSAAAMLGMVIGGCFWGMLADLEGKRKSLFISLFSYTIFEIASSLIPSYWGFLILKFLGGFSIQGSSGAVFPYLGEFQSGKIREKMMCWMEMAWSVGLIVLPLIGWAIIPLEISFVMDTFSFHSWNLFIIVCALPSLLLALWLLTFPETPKYLAETENYGELANTLGIMHKENTGKSFDVYLETLSKNGCHELSLKLQTSQVKTDAKCTPTKNNRHKELLRNLSKQTALLFKPPLLAKTANVCSIIFCLGSAYYALMLWFPEVFQRFLKFENDFPGASASVCSISQQQNAVNETFQQIDECPITVSRDVYVHTLILGVSCVPLSVLLPLFVNKLGYKFYLVVSALIAAGVSVGLLFVDSSSNNLILSCIFEATSSIGMSIILCIIVEIFPTNSRAMAAAICGTFARIGAFVGNSMFGYLIDGHCTILIYIITFKLLVCAVLGYLLPETRHPKTASQDNSVS